MGWYCNRIPDYHTVWDRGPLERMLASGMGAAECVRELRTTGYSHVVVDHSMLRRWRASGWLDAGITDARVDAFLDLRVPGTKVVVGDGPELDSLTARYPDVRFLGKLSGDALASAYRSADCFVFPSRTDTFGLVVIEALACGVPVAAYPVTGPVDILGHDGRGADVRLASPAGAISGNLHDAVAQALLVDRDAPCMLAEAYSWERATDLFLGALQGALQTGRADRRLEFA